MNVRVIKKSRYVMPLLKQSLMGVCEAWGAADMDEDLHDVNYMLVALIVMSDNGLKE